MSNTGTPLKHIRDRRREPHTEQIFERRFGNDKDALAIRKFDEIGADKVQVILSRGLFGRQSGAAKRWLESQGEGHSVWDLKLTLTVAIGCIFGVLLSSAL